MQRREFFSPGDIALQLGVTVDDVSAEIDRLRELGCTFESNPQFGVKLLRTDISTWVDYLEERCGRVIDDDPDSEDSLGGKREISVFRSTESTQDVAQQKLRGGGASAYGTVVIADEQRAGRGRLGRRWVAPAGTCVLFSMVHIANPFDDESINVERLVTASAVAIASAIENVTGESDAWVKIKWPNDLYIGGRKVAGILVDAIDNAAVIGVGINVSFGADEIPDEAAEFRDAMTSLAMEGKEVDRLYLLSSAIRSIDIMLGQTSDRQLADEWRRRSVNLSKQIHLRCDGHDIRGEVVDLDPSAGLIVRKDTGELVHLPSATTSVVS